MNKLAESIGNIRNFFGEVKTELVKCSWPSRKELFGSSLVVIVSVLILGAFVGACDLLNMAFLEFIIR